MTRHILGTTAILAFTTAVSANPVLADQVRSIIELEQNAVQPADQAQPGNEQKGEIKVLEYPPAPKADAPSAEPVAPQKAEEPTDTKPAPDTGGTLTAQEIEIAEFDGSPLPDGRSALTAKVQIMLDRGGVSPGVIDGYSGENVRKAISAYEEINGLPVDGELDADVWAALQAQGGNVMQTYDVTEQDVADLVPPLPEDYSELAKLDRLGYTSALEKLAERFHMDEEFLGFLNPGADFSRPGTKIIAANPGTDVKPQVRRIIADKSRSRLLVYDDAGDLVLSYPVTIGSRDTPSPSGTHEVLGVAFDPTYSYDPKNFKQGDNNQPLTLPPGPNGPVGGTWIDLSKPTYGLHGTPHPDTIGKTGSHGCVRLTNWDANELGHAVKKGVTVEFRD